jgi:hypothetical protein
MGARDIAQFVSAYSEGISSAQRATPLAKK